MSERDQLIQLIASTIRPPGAATIDELAALVAGSEWEPLADAMRAMSQGRAEAAQMASGLLLTGEVYRLTGEAILALTEGKTERGLERAEEIADLAREDQDDP